MQTQGFSPAIAINTRKADVLTRNGTNRVELVRQIAATVAANIRIYRSANSELSFVDFLKKYGGFSSFIDTAIGREPVGVVNKAGIIENDDYWLWQVKNDLREEVLHKVKMSLEADEPEPSTVKAILIDAYNKEIREVQFTPDLKNYYELLKCDCITIGYRFPDGDALFVDDEGLLKDPTHFFRIPGIDYDYAGNGLIVGDDGQGGEADCKLDARFIGVLFQELIPQPVG